MGPLVSEVEVSREQGVNGPERSAGGHDPNDSPARRHSSVADVVGATIAAQGVKDAFGVLGQRQLGRDQRAVPARRSVPPRPPRDERTVHGRRIRPRNRRCRRLQRSPGPGPDQHDDRARRGGEEQDAGAGARRRDSRGGLDLELPDRSARPGRVGRRDRRPRPRREDRSRRRRPRVPAGADRAPPGRADAADRHPAPAGRPNRAVQAPAPNAASPRAGGRSNHTSRGPAYAGAKTRDHRRQGRGARGCRRGARTARADDRRGPRHVRAGQRPVRGPPVRARDLGWVREPVRGRAAARGRRRARGRRLGQPLDYQARRDHRPRGAADPGRRRPAGNRAKPAGRPGDRR